MGYGGALQALSGVRIEAYFDACTALKAHVVATSFIRLYAMQMTAFWSLH